MYQRKRKYFVTYSQFKQGDFIVIQSDECKVYKNCISIDTYNDLHFKNSIKVLEKYLNEYPNNLFFVDHLKFNIGILNLALYLKDIYFYNNILFSKQLNNKIIELNGK